ncbi:MAG: GntR family transcriptional regulator [Beduini sp.]|uniref:GntR family transcriptional regulator n=1 Tax=Beduini sp. TaxID=1922300 RepID=UPI0011CB5C94
MEIILSNSSNKAIYEQIVSQIKAMIMNGTLKPGDSLPSIRGLAKSLHISVITSQHAYEDLVRDGFIETVAGKGTFVSHQNKDFVREEQLRILEAKAEELVEDAKMNGIQLSQLIETITLLYKEDENGHNS